MQRTTAAGLGAMGLVCLMLNSVGLAGDTGTIKGQMTGEGHGLRGYVQLAPGAGRAVTDGRGHYTLAVDAGAYTLTCAAPGWKPTTRRVKVAPGQTVTANCALQRLAPEAPADLVQAAEAEESRAAARSTRGAGRRAPAKKRARRPAPVALAPAPVAASPRQPVKFEAAYAAPAPRIDADASGEGYNRIEEGRFKTAKDAPLSTFSIDVDTAAYANVRRFLNQDRLPPADAVRIEELINYFDYDYAQPKGDHPFAIHTEISRAPWNPANRLVHVGLQGYEVQRDTLPPANLVFLLDVSGSMNRPNKLPLLKQAMHLLIDELRPQDTVSIVVYAGAAGLVLPPTSGQHKDRILNAFNSLRAGGSTAGGAGIELAYQVAKDNFVKGGNNRVILATDGDFNVGVSSQKGLIDLIEQKRDGGVFLTVLGFGTGNYQGSKMEQLANKGNGNAAYIDSLLEAKKVLVTEMGGTLLTIAKDVKIQVEFNPAKVHSYRLVGYENRALANRDFNDDKKDAGELGAGHTVTVLYEIVPVGAEGQPGVDPLKYQQPALTKTAAHSNELMTVKLRYKRPDGDKSTLITHPMIDTPVALDATSANFRFSAAVASYGMLLRGSKYAASASWDQVVSLARAAKGDDTNGYRAEFIKLAEKAQILHRLKHGKRAATVTQIAR